MERNTYNLTPREEEILGLLLDGFSYKDIALKLVISEKTLKTHMVAIFRKKQVHSLHELVCKEHKERLNKLMEAEEYKSFWFSGIGFDGCIGIVKTQSGRLYIGCGVGIDKKLDEKRIAEYGSPINLEQVIKFFEKEV